MGSQGSPPLVIHVTGFKRFHGVDENPSEALMAALLKAVAKEEDRLLNIPPGVILGSVTVLETAGLGALPTLQKLLHSSLPQNSASIHDEQIIWVHVGVNTGVNKFAIERRAVNEATFRCADEMGWQPQRVPIVEKDGEISNSRETNVPVGQLVDALAGKGYAVMVSNDAGRFVCNYVYYHSLCHAAAHGTKCLFVHVPPFSRIEKGTQLSFLFSLFEALASLQQL